MSHLAALKTAVALLLPLTLGFAGLGLFRALGGLWSRLWLSVGVGFGLSSLLFFLWISTIGKASVGFMLLQGVVALLLGLAGCGLAFRRRPGAPTLAASGRPLDSGMEWAFALVLWLSLAVSTLHFLYNPHGDWDAWDLWNVRALFLAKAGRHWADIFSPEMPRAMDYPLMLSGAIAGAWKFVGATAVWIPGAIALLFTLATTGFLVTSLKAIRGGSQGWLAGIVLASTPFFAQHGASQYADIEIAYYLLGSVGLWVWSDYELSPSSSKIAISGLLAGLAAWTKNEGMLLFLAILAARILCWARPGNFRATARESAVWLLGALPGLVALGHFRQAIAPPNDIFSVQSPGQLFEKLMDADRYVLIAKNWIQTSISFGRWRFGIPLALLVYAAALGRSAATPRLRQFPILALALSAIGYFLVYVVTSYELNWHLGTSLNRLFFQLWPSALFAYFLWLRSPEEFASQDGE